MGSKMPKDDTSKADAKIEKTQDAQHPVDVDASTQDAKDDKSAKAGDADASSKPRKRRSAASAKIADPTKKKAKAGERVPFSVRVHDADPSYWDQPRWIRAYMRVLYAVMAFALVIYLFDHYSSAPDWLQITLGIAVAIMVIMFRMAFPGGVGNIFGWIMEGVAEAAAEQEAKGKTPSVSSAEARAAIKDGGMAAWAKKKEKKALSQDTLFGSRKKTGPAKVAGSSNAKGKSKKPQKKR